MSSLNNLEKLIQMATIEQMYSMLQKMSENINNNTCSCNNKNNVKDDDDTKVSINEIRKMLKKYLSDEETKSVLKTPQPPSEK
jgi:hypothetical protein